MKNNKGITLIALVITIIVLLILAGVALAMLAGDNGLLTKASDSKIVNEIGALKDQVNLAAAEGLSDYFENEYVAATKTEGLTKKSAVYKKAGAVTTSSSYVQFANVEAESKIVIQGTGDKNYLKAEGTVQDDGTISWVDTFKK